MSFALHKHKIDQVGRILILNMAVDKDNYIAINLYNANTETEQVKILQELENLLKKFDIN